MLSAGVASGTEQRRELRQSAVPVPSGDQMYRLLSTWLARAQRSLRATCSVPQHGIRLAPGMTVRLKSRMFASTKTMLVTSVTDNPRGSFDLAMVEYSAADFSLAAYVAQTVITTTTQLAVL